MPKRDYFLYGLVQTSFFKLLNSIYRFLLKSLIVLETGLVNILFIVLFGFLVKIILMVDA